MSQARNAVEADERAQGSANRDHGVARRACTPRRRGATSAGAKTGQPLKSLSRFPSLTSYNAYLLISCIGLGGALGNMRYALSPLTSRVLMWGLPALGAVRRLALRGAPRLASGAVPTADAGPAGVPGARPSARPSVATCSVHSPPAPTAMLARKEPLHGRGSDCSGRCGAGSGRGVGDCSGLWYSAMSCRYEACAAGAGGGGGGGGGGGCGGGGLGGGVAGGGCGGVCIPHVVKPIGPSPPQYGSEYSLSKRGGSSF